MLKRLASLTLLASISIAAGAQNSPLPEPAGTTKISAAIKEPVDRKAWRALAGQTISCSAGDRHKAYARVDATGTLYVRLVNTHYPTNYGWVRSDSYTLDDNIVTASVEEMKLTTTAWGSCQARWN